MMITRDEGIRAVREVRERISAEFGNDPDKLVEHYMHAQEEYRERLLKPAASRSGTSPGIPPKGE
jgi:hypothetical protein